jgi:hypothetical protein
LVVKLETERIMPATGEDTARSLLGTPYYLARLEAAKLEWELFAYYNFGVGHPPGVDGGPEPHIDFKGLATGRAIVGMLGSVAFPNPEGDGPDPAGPLGPVMRDVLIGLTVFQLASQLGDKASSQSLGKVGADLVVQGAKRMTEGLR